MLRFWQAAWADNQFHYYACRCNYRGHDAGYAFKQDRCPTCGMDFQDDISKFGASGPGIEIRFRG